eukprot:scaffold75668_cov75-Phaeocystis_antarctica.AAC.4
MRSCDSIGISKLPGGDGAQEDTIKVEQSQPGALRMGVIGQNDYLVAMHSDVADGLVIIIINILRGNICGLDRGDDLQVSVKEDQRVASFVGISDSIGPLSLLMHCTFLESSVIVGMLRHRRQLIHRAVLSELAREAPEAPCGETAGPAGRQSLWVGIAARSDELHAARYLVVIITRGNRQHAAGQHAEASRVYGHTSQPPLTPRVDVAASPQLPAVGTRPGGAHTCSGVLREPERAEELGQQVRRQQDIHAPRRERRHLGDEGVGLVLELGRALAGVHGDFQELRVREVGQAQAAHETGGNGRGGCRDLEGDAARNFASSAPEQPNSRHVTSTRSDLGQPDVLCPKVASRLIAVG